jgi:membrane-bound lytic murein transglycosylase B
MPVTPDRPRHVPRHAAPPAVARAAVLRIDDDEIKAPGLAAMIRRSPQVARQLAAGAIGVGVVLFVVAGVASASPQAHPKRHAAAPAVVTGSPIAPAPLPAATTAATSTRDRIAAKNLAARPVTSKTKAPSTKKVISGLAANGIPKVALNAYRVAAARMATVEPSCGIDWAMLAGIGREESDHGRFAGAVLSADGTSTPRIIGPALDGVGSDYIAAPANGYALDGDAKYTRALGPMQFIPQTWASYGVDANGDGKADIFNINDAALGAARYLCAAGGNLRTQAGRVAGVLAYNHNDAYLAQVLALAQAYRTGVKVTGIPVGNLTGALPPITPGSVLAVNPGLPTAVGATQRGKQLGKHTGTHPGSTKSGSTPTSKPTATSTTSSTKHTGKPAGSTSSPPKSGTSSSAPKPGSGSSSSGSSGGSGAGGGSGGSPGGGTGGSPTPTPTPSPSCKIGIGGACLIQ